MFLWAHMPALGSVLMLASLFAKHILGYTSPHIQKIELPLPNRQSFDKHDCFKNIMRAAFILKAASMQMAEAACAQASQTAIDHAPHYMCWRLCVCVKAASA